MLSCYMEVLRSSMDRVKENNFTVLGNLNSDSIISSVLWLPAHSIPCCMLSYDLLCLLWYTWESVLSPVFLIHQTPNVVYSFGCDSLSFAHLD